MSTWLAGKVVGHKHWNEYLHTLYIEADIAPFEAGQFVKIGLELKGEVLGHPYSLVNAPEQKPLEILYIEVPGGQLSPHLVKLQPGDTVQVSPEAHGFMVLNEVPPSPHLWLLATGTGVGPFISMLMSEKIWLRHDHVVLVYAVRLQQDMVYLDRIHEIASRHPDTFTFIPIVSREHVANTLSGRIPQALTAGTLEEKAGFPVSVDTDQFILCGNPDMVADTQACLMQRGFKKHRRRDPGHITTETYW